MEEEEKEEGEGEEGDFNDFTAEPLTSSDEIRIEDVDQLDTANIFAIIGVVVGIVIFVIITLVLLLLGVQRTNVKKAAKPEEDVISQSSYMTYSTTVSDTSVNYSHNWDKDMLEDLCSIDNDSFLTSLEAVTTTDYWE